MKQVVCNVCGEVFEDSVESYVGASKVVIDVPVKEMYFGLIVYHKADMKGDQKKSNSKLDICQDCIEKALREKYAEADKC